MEPVTVFVVDDTPDTREALGQLLRRAGYHAVCVGNGWEAIKLLEETEPAVVLLDVGMPVMDGLSTLRAIRQDPAWRYLPVLVLSGRTDEGSTAEARCLGATDYLPKGSTSPEKVLRRVRHYAGRSPAPRN